MYIVRFYNQSLQFVDQNSGSVLYDQPFRPATNGEDSRPWASADEAMEYWNSSARTMYSNISDEEITVATE